MLFATFSSISTHSYSSKWTQEINFKAQQQNLEKRLLHIYIYVCVWTYTHTHTHIHTYIHTHTITHTYIYIYIYIYITHRKAGFIGLVWKNVASVVSLFAFELTALVLQNATFYLHIFPSLWDKKRNTDKWNMCVTS
jgi:hypothetical protein